MPSTQRSIPASATADRPGDVVLAPAPRIRDRLLRSPSGLVAVVVLGAGVAVVVLAGVLAPHDPFTSVGPPLQPPSTAYPMGTDDLGRDILSNVLHGVRTSVVIALAVAALSTPVAVSIGLIAGSGSALADDVLMRATELVQVLPRFFLAVMVIALWGPGIDNIILLLGLTSWPWTARVVRAETLALRNREFVVAAYSLGASRARVVVRHLMPNALPPAIVLSSLVASSAVLIEAGLGFIGLADPEVVSLGTLANNAQRFLRIAWWMSVFPGVAILILVLAINLLGDALNDVSDPRRALAADRARGSY